MKNKHSKLLALIISGVVLLFTLIFIFSPKQSCSDNENCNLKSNQHFRLSDIMSGKWMRDVDDYVENHFPFRDFFVSLKSNTEVFLGSRKISGVFIGRDGYLLLDYEKPTKSEEFVQVLNSFKMRNNHVNMNVMLIPTSISVNKDKLPNHAVSYDEVETIHDIYDKISFSSIDVYDTLLKNNENYPMYYKLDHHYTSYGAYFAYLEYCKQNNLKPREINEYNIEAVTSDFKGTLYSKVHLYGHEADSIYLFTPKDSQDLKVEYITGDKVITSTSLYEYSYLDKEDKYGFFLNGDQPLVKITNNKNTNEKKLLVIKDSYANSIIPYLTHHYHEVHVIDPRYYKSSISLYIDQAEITDVLFLYNINTLDKDTGIYSIK